MKPAVPGLHQTRSSWRRYAEQKLQQRPVSSVQPHLLGVEESTHPSEFQHDADVLLQHVLDCSRASLYAWPQKALEPHELATLESLLLRRMTHEPLAYLTGQAPFHSRDFTVTPQVLVPRDDTETLVRLAIDSLLHRQDAVALPTECPTILDIGTGSGAVAVTVAAETGLPVLASDVSAEALTVAAMNAERHAPGGVSLVQGDWLCPFADRSATLIIGNPPYIALHDPHLEHLTHEPELALVSGLRGLDAIQRIIGDAVRVGRPGCPVMLEHGYDQGSEVRALMHQSGLVNIRTEIDLAGHERVTLGSVASEAS